jgi:PAS domain S-box-containing protein
VSLARYVFVVAAVAVATLLRSALTPAIGHGVPFILLFPTVVLCGWFGGLWPGLLATALGGLVAWYVLMPPYYSFAVTDPTAPGQTILFLLASTLISLLAESLHRARRTAEAERERFRVTLASVGDAVITTDREGLITTMNGVAELVTGWRADDAVGRPLDEIFRIVNEATREPVDNPALRAIREGGIVGLTSHTLLIRKDGTEASIDDSGAPIRDARGTMFGAVLSFRDITERRRGETVLEAAYEDARRRQREAESLAALARTLNMLDLDRALQNVAESACTLLECAVATVFRLDAGSETLTLLAGGGPGGSTPTRNVSVPRGFGLVWLAIEQRTAVVSLDLLTDDRFAYSPAMRARIEAGGHRAGVAVPLMVQERIIGALFVGVLPGRRFSDDEIRLVTTFADHAAVAIRNAELYDEAQRANRAKDEFLAMLSHELRSPLGTILGWARMLRLKQTAADQTERALAAIERNARLQARLIEDLLDVSRIVSGKLTLEMQRVELAPIVEAALDTIRDQAETARITITCDIGRDVPSLIGDPVRLQQVVANLLSNAIKFTDRGGWIAVRTRRLEDAVELVVQDSGCGISPELLPFVFERFRQGEPGGRSGLGLGLTIVRHLVERHGGTVRAESPGDGHGATFTVLLPLAARPESNDASPGTETEQGRPSGAGPLAGLRILVVEDDADTRDLLRTVLSNEEARVSVARSAKEARERLAEQPVDVVISDIAMPEETGHELIRSVRASNGSARRVLAIALTAYARAEDEKEALAAGFDHHVGKPIDPPDLIALIARSAPRA